MPSLSRFSAALLCLLLVACQPPAPAPDLSAPSFVDQPPLLLDVSEIRLTDRYKPGEKPRHVERFFPISPASGVKIWVRERVRAAGEARLLEITIHEASVVETPLELKRGIKGAFTKEPSKQYEATVEVELKIYGGERLLPEAEVRSKATVVRSVQEDATAAEHDALFATITRDLLDKLDASLERSIREYFTRYLVAP